MKKKTQTLSLAALLAAAVLTPSLQAQEKWTDKVDVKLSGRAMMDMGGYLGGKGSHWGNGAKFDDLRMGFKASMGAIGLKAEIGYAGNKVSIKDAFLSYTHEAHRVQAGQMYEPYSIDNLGSSVDMMFHQKPGAVQALSSSRRMGALYSYNVKSLLLQGGVFAGDASAAKNASQGIGLDARAVWRPVNDGTNLLHVGLAGGWRTPDGNADKNLKAFAYKNAGPAAIDSRSILKASVTGAKSQARLGAELLCTTKKLSLQGEYMLSSVKREGGLKTYTGQGGYLQAGWLLLGEGYGYDAWQACSQRPKGRALELCARFNVTNLNDTEAGVRGGLERDLSVGVNYFLNKHLGVKLNYSYVMPGADVKDIAQKNYSAIQARLQFVL